MAEEHPAIDPAIVEAIRRNIRSITHELSSPLGILRMTTHYLRTQEVTTEKRDHYLKVINDTVDRLEDGLHRMRALADPEYQPPSPSDRPDTAAH